MKKILACVLCVVLSLSLLAGCGGSAKDDGTIKIGWLGPLTGDVAQYGIAVQNGVKLYVDQLNEAGGINGRQIELVSYDEEGDTVKAVTGYNALMDAGVIAIIGDVTTQPCAAVVAESQKDMIPMITASATASYITYDEETDTVYENVFRSCFIDPFQGETMARFAKEIVGASTAAILYDNGDPYSKGVYDYFVAKCTEIGVEVVAEESYATGSVDFSGQLTNIAATDPDVLFLPVYYNDVALIASQAADAGIDATMLGVDGWSSVLDTVSDAALVEGAYYCSGYSVENTSELVQNFLADYGEAYNGEVPNMFGAQGYDAAWILCNAIASVEEEGTAKYGTAEYSEAIIAALNATDAEFVTGHVSYDEHNDPQKTASIIYLEGGAEKFWGSY